MNQDIEPARVDKSITPAARLTFQALILKRAIGRSTICGNDVHLVGWIGALFVPLPLIFGHILSRLKSCVLTVLT